MEFLHPYWLFGLFAVSIPIFIHLFNFRRYKRVYFTNLKFLKSIKNETRKQNRLRHLLILISRILAIIFLVMAFARPYIPGPGGTQRSAVRYVSVFVDNSMSMQAASGGSSLLDIARAKAASVADAYGPSDRFQLVTNDFKGKHQHYYNRDEFLTLLSEVQISPAFRLMPEVFERMRETEIPDPDVEVHEYYISDFQQSSYGEGPESADTTTRVFLLPLVEQAAGNIYIDSCWFESPYNHLNQPQKLNVSVTNASPASLDRIPVKLLINGRQHALGSLDLPEWGRTEISLPVSNAEAGQQWASLRIEDYPITWDDELYLNWTVKDRIPVLAITEDEPAYYLSNIFSNDSAFRYRVSMINKLDYSQFGDADLIILDNVISVSTGLANELNEFVSSGGSLLIIPAMEADLNTVNILTAGTGLGRLGPYDTNRLAVTGLDAEHILFDGVFEDLPENLDLPLVNGHFPIEAGGNEYQQVIMDLQNGDPYLLLTEYGSGKAYLLTCPMGDSYGNLARHALWVPLTYRMSMLSRPQNRLYYIMGKENVIGVKLDLMQDEQVFIRKRDTEYEFLPVVDNTGDQEKLMLFNMIKEPGHYGVYAENVQLMGFSFNYDRMESNPEIVGMQEIEEDIARRGAENVYVVDSAEGQVDQSLAELSQGRGLWKYFIWLALVFILLEILLLRLYRSSSSKP